MAIVPGTAGVETGKGARTRARILRAATDLFAARGYDGASIRDIESAAEVKRGLVTYHFGNKQSLWEAMFHYTFAPVLHDLHSKAALIKALDSTARGRFLIEYFIRTSAQRPQMTRLMMQENFEHTWRTDWIVENYLVPFRELNAMFGEDDPMLQRFEREPHLRYTLLGACNFAYSHPLEVEALFGQDVFSEAFIQQHVDTVLALFENLSPPIQPQEN